MPISAEKINVLDTSTSKRRKKFGDHIKNNAFSKCHKKLKLLTQICDGDSNNSPYSDRDNVIFKFQYAQKVLNIEKNLMLNHAESSQKVKDACITVLKLKPNSSIITIKNNLNEGDMTELVRDAP